MRFWLIAGLTICALAADARTWRSQKGTTVDAEIVGMQNGRVQLRTTDNQTIEIAYAALCAEDQAFIQELVAKQQAEAQGDFTPAGGGDAGATPEAGTEPTTPESQPPPATPPAPPATPPAPSRPGATGRGKTSGDVLSDEELAGLKVEVTTRNERERLAIGDVKISAPPLSDREAKRWRAGRPLPFKLEGTVRLDTKDGKEFKQQVFPGTLKMYLVDSTGRVVFDKNVAARDMYCPPGSSAGYAGTVPAPGKYTGAIYVKYEKQLVGVKLELEVPTPVAPEPAGR